MKDFIYHREGERIGVSVPKEITEEVIDYRNTSRKDSRKRRIGS